MSKESHSDDPESEQSIEKIYRSEEERKAREYEGDIDNTKLAYFMRRYVDPEIIEYYQGELDKVHYSDARFTEVIERAKIYYLENCQVALENYHDVEVDTHVTGASEISIRTKNNSVEFEKIPTAKDVTEVHEMYDGEMIFTVEMFGTGQYNVTIEI